ncbi:MAG: hypothetical protein ACXU89_25365, partial [Xanthobacteraceae bacterium]
MSGKENIRGLPDQQASAEISPPSQQTLKALSPRAALVYDNINAATSPDILDNIARAVWHDWGEGAFTDDEASFLTGAINRRRPVTFHRPARAGAGPSKPIGRLLGRLGSRFTPRQRPRSPDRKASRDRRRMLGGSSALPDNLRHHYTAASSHRSKFMSAYVKKILPLCEDLGQTVFQIAGQADIKITEHQLLDP